MATIGAEAAYAYFVEAGTKYMAAHPVSVSCGSGVFASVGADDSCGD